MGWTEHLALPEAEPEPEPVQATGAALHVVGTAMGGTRIAAPERPDDGLLHPRAKDVVFAGSPRGAVDAPSERRLLDRERLAGTIGAQVAGAVALTVFCWFVAITRFVGLEFGAAAGAALGFGILVPIAMRQLLKLQARLEFWWTWCATRGFEPGAASGPGAILPKRLERSPLLGSVEERAFDYVARRELTGREAIVGSLIRRPARALGAEGDDDQAFDHWRVGVVVMPLPRAAAARWAGASIRADHHAQRPIVMRSMLGALIAPAFAECRAHLAAMPTQDERTLQMFVDAKLDQYLADHPMDIDIIGNLLVVTRDGAPDDADTLDELCRDALLLHERLAAEHEVAADRPVEFVPVAAMPAEEEPVIDLSRDGWGEGDDSLQYYEAA